MHYPWWHVPHLTSPMVIALVATVHVLVALYAVGGGLFLAVETRHAHRSGNRAYLEYLHRHARFFVLLTVVFGAITGVGIWWSIGLASPLATEVLLRIFVFGWAMEYVCFVVEIVSAFLFYHLWGRVSPATHVRFGWIYAASAWLSLVVITGITSFMLHSGDWVEEGGFWRALLNPQFVPQVLVRTGGALLLASMYVYAHAAFAAHEAGLRRLIARRSTRPALAGALLIAAGTLAWLLNLPEHALVSLEKAPALNVFVALLLAITVAVFLVFAVGPPRDPAWITPGFAVLFLLLGAGAVAIGEFVREAVRKPWVVDGVVLSNQVLAWELEASRRAGILERGGWTRAFVRARHPGAVEGSRIDEVKLLALPAAERVALGEVVFMHQCNDCHAAERGLSAIRNLIRDWPDERLREVARLPETFDHVMPPFAGTAEEAELLAQWLVALRPSSRGLRRLPSSAPGRASPGTE